MSADAVVWRPVHLGPGEGRRFTAVGEEMGDRFATHMPGIATWFREHRAT